MWRRAASGPAPPCRSSQSVSLAPPPSSYSRMCEARAKVKPAERALGFPPPQRGPRKVHSVFWRQAARSRRAARSARPRAGHALATRWQLVGATPSEAKPRWLVAGRMSDACWSRVGAALEPRARNRPHERVKGACLCASSSRVPGVRSTKGRLTFMCLVRRRRGPCTPPRPLARRREAPARWSCSATPPLPHRDDDVTDSQRRRDT